MLSEARADRAILIGGLGWPHDELAVALLSRSGLRAQGLGALDLDALERGRAALPPGQCAPMLYLTGALLRAVESRAEPFSLVALQSRGPCRYALFATEWRRLLAERGRSDVSIAPMSQHAPELMHWLTPDALEALACADALAETARRLAPSAEAPDEVDRAARGAGTRIAKLISNGERPIAALRAERDWHVGLSRAPARPLARAVVVGEPWSLHADGDGQLHLPQALARAASRPPPPPACAWLAYLAWQAQGPTWGSHALAPATRDRARELGARLRELYATAGEAAGLEDLELDDPAALAARAEPYLQPSLRGGYGALELGWIARARAERRAHVVFSIKSFGCVPSAGITDAIAPSVLEDELPYLALEVCGDGEAARESRLALFVASALEAARDEVERAGGRASGVTIDPLRARRGPRPYACSLACALHDRAQGASQ